MQGHTPQGNAANEIDIAATIDSAAISALQWRVFALTLAASIFDGFDTMVMSFLAPAITQEWGASHAAFGLVFSATLLGAAIGAATLGLLADRAGRKKLVMVAILWFGLLTIACAFATGITSLVLLRFVAGLGLGGAIPNMLALAAEYAPARRRSTIVSIITWGTPLGAVLGGLIAPNVLMLADWRAMLLVAGIAPVLLVPLLWIGLPESVRFLALKDSNDPRLLVILRRICPFLRVSADTRFVLTERRVGRATIGALFRDGLAAGTILLSAAMFTSLLLSFMLVNWTPTLLERAGIPLSDAILGTIVLNLSGIVGSLGISRVVDGRLRGSTVLAISYLFAVAAILSAGTATLLEGVPLPVLMATLGASGFFLIGSQITLSAYITAFFPTALRGTGIGFNNAVARCGSLFGPALGGILLSAGINPAHILFAGIIPGLFSAVALGILAFIQTRGRADTRTHLIKNRGLA
ncbi:MFS transporter [Sphingomonas sp. QA11]|uniref:MFS transporter n=1 Tax=Sphingomonas sp. QA11 TaxID=2950605 RepID=UPI0023495C9C|nr:MFS transporter [Sphingomonas sp. QA11]WCM28608.1 MFS transporter [Sphingomonas sp. QA11]